MHAVDVSAVVVLNLFVEQYARHCRYECKFKMYIEIERGGSYRMTYAYIDTYIARGGRHSIHVGLAQARPNNIDLRDYFYSQLTFYLYV